MKFILTIFSIAISLNPTYAQETIIGKYYHNFGHQLILNEDSTFEYLSHFDLASTWSNGKWSYNRDTLYLQYIPIFDTLRIGAYNKYDTLVLSADRNSERIEDLDHISSILSGGGQNRKPSPFKLFFKKNELYEITPEGKLLTKNMYDPFRDKYFSTRYYKAKN